MIINRTNFKSKVNTKKSFRVLLKKKKQFIFLII